MLTLTYTAALILCLSAIAAGLLIGWAHFRLRTGAEFVPVTVHREEIVALRRRYRRRLRALRDLSHRHKLNEEQLRSELRVASDHQATQTKLMTAAQAEISTLRARIGVVNEALGDHERDAALLRAREQSLTAELRDALERIAGFERDHGLLRIERDELVARTERLRALTIPETTAEDHAPDEAPAFPAAAPRAELADRNARIHELECELRGSEQRMTELESSLNTWKYRIAPMALHMKLQRERAERAQPAESAAPARAPDDLKRIRGIGRGLEKKLRAEGIAHIAQIAGMAPAELANLAVRVGLAASRPLRDRWSEQARQLCDLPATGAEPPARAAPRTETA